MLFLSLFALIPLLISAEQIVFSQQEGRQVQIDDCGNGKLAIHDVTVYSDPYPPQRGQNVAINITAKLNRNITEGMTYEASVKMGFIRFPLITGDLCKAAEDPNSPIHCPIAAGDFHTSVSVGIPKGIPATKYQVNVKVKSGNDMIGCLNTNLPLA